MVLFSVVLALAVFAVISRRITSRSNRQAAENSSMEPGSTANGVSRKTLTLYRTERLNKMTRSVKRLDEVEHDLISKITRSEKTDQPTVRLIAEMRICTNRILAQLGDMEREAEELSKQKPPA
jgi:hypothetical protein